MSEDLDKRQRERHPLPPPGVGQHHEWAGQSLADGPHLSRVPGLTPDRQPHRAVGVRGRDAVQQWIRGHRQFGIRLLDSPSPISTSSPARIRSSGSTPWAALWPSARRPAGTSPARCWPCPAAPSGAGSCRPSMVARAAHSTGISASMPWTRTAGALTLAGRVAPAVHQPRVGDQRHHPPAELSVREQRPHRQRPGAGERSGARPQRCVHVFRSDAQHDAPGPPARQSASRPRSSSLWQPLLP